MRHNHEQVGGVLMKLAFAKTCVAFIAFPFLLLLHAPAFGQVEKAWDVHYDSPYGGAMDDHDWAYDIAVDDFGNSYVTGWSAGRWFSSTWEHDFLTIKYDPQGNEVWVGRYGGTEHDGAYAIALDRDANVYVTGFIEDYGLDYLTVKYDTDGNELWVATWGGQTANDAPNAIIVDDLGNVYVTGYSESFGTGSDYLTIKYDTNGNELWTARYNGPGTSYKDDIPFDIAVDSRGNAYVTGASSGVGTGGDYATIKYDANGNELWVARYDGPGSLRDNAVAVAVNSAGEVFVTGTADSNYHDSNYTTIKYDSDGNELWVAYYAEGYHGNMPAAMAIDAASNVYVTGWSDGITTDDDYATVKYDTDGKELWVARYDGVGLIDNACDIAVDIDGSVAVTGSSKYGDLYYEEDIVTIKYDANGNELWTHSYDAVGRDDIANAIALDREGNVCVTGWSDMEYSNVFTTIKYVPTVSLGFTCLTPIVAQGGTLKYQVSIENNTSESQDIWAWIKEKLPSGEWSQGYHVPPTNLILDPNQAGTYLLRETIPLSALLGPHEYWGYIGSDTLAVWDCDMFPFSVYSRRYHREVKDR